MGEGEGENLPEEFCDNILCNNIYNRRNSKITVLSQQLSAHL